MPVISRLCKSHIMIAAGERQIAYVNNGLELRCIRFTPEHISLWSVPWQITCNLNTICHFVKGKALKIWIIGKDEVEIIHAVFKQTALGMVHQLCFPIFVFSVEICLCIRKSFVGGEYFDLILLHGKLTHIFEGRLVVD